MYITYVSTKCRENVSDDLSRERKTGCVHSLSAVKWGKPKIFVITLAGNNPVYFAGSNIEGNVTLELSEPKKMQGISIVLSQWTGQHWTEQRTTGTGEHQRTETVHYSDSETILNPVSLQLRGNGKDSPEPRQELAAGRYEFPFKFQLPYN